MIGRTRKGVHFIIYSTFLWASQVAQLVKNPPQCGRLRFDSRVGKIPWRRDRLPTPVFLGFPGSPAGKESAWNVGDLGSIPELERYLGEGKCYPLQYSGLENSMDSIAHGVTKSRTRLSDSLSPFCLWVVFGFFPKCRKSHV